MTYDGFHNYTYDAEGNITAVDGGATAQYVYNALNQRVRTVVGSSVTEIVFNANGQHVSTWNPIQGWEIAGQTYWGSKPVEFYADGYAHFQHQDWLGTERARTSYTGAMEGAFTSLPFGDAQATSGADYDAYHFAALDHDYESGTDHAQFRQYNNAQGRWLSPDPYRGSYDVSNPQSMNRYAYVVNNPLANIDPSGLVQADASWLNLQQLLAMSAGAQAYNLGYVLSNGGGINSPQGEFDLVNIPVTQYAYGDIPLNVPMGGGSCGQNCSYSMTLTSLGWGSVQVGTGLDFLMNWQPPTQLTPQTVAPTAPNKPAMPSTIVGYVKWAWNGGQGQSLQTRMLCTPIAAANVDGAYESIALTGVTVGAGLVGGLPGAGAAVGIGGGALALQSQLVKEANELTGCFQ